MKISATQQKKEFKPFILSLEIENEDELKVLWNRFDLSLGDIERANRESHKIVDSKIDENISYDIWKILDDKLSNDD